MLSIIGNDFKDINIEYLGAEIKLVRAHDNIASLLGMTDFGNDDKYLEKFSYVPTAFWQSEDMFLKILEL